MKFIATLLLLFVGATSFAQTHYFKPLWKVGDKKEMKITRHEQKFKDEVLVEDTAWTNEATIRVVGETADMYMLKVKMENQALRAAIELSDKINEELDKYRDLKLTYTVDKETGAAELQNWEDAQKFMNESVDAMVDLISKKDKDVAFTIGLMMAPMKMSFSSKESIEAYMDFVLGPIVKPFGHDFEVGKPITTTETGTNPMNPQLDVTVSTTYKLHSFNPATKMAVIHENIDFDMSELLEMIKGMVRSMMEAAAKEGEDTEDFDNVLDKMKMEAANLNAITYDSESSWVTFAKLTATVTAVEPRDQSQTRKVVTQTVTVD